MKMSLDEMEEVLRLWWVSDQKPSLDEVKQIRNALRRNASLKLVKEEEGLQR